MGLKRVAIIRVRVNPACGIKPVPVGIGNPSMEAIGRGIQPKDRIGTVDSGSRECFPAGINVFINLGAAARYGLDSIAYCNGKAIGTS